MAARTVEYDKFNNSLQRELSENDDPSHVMDIDVHEYDGMIGICRMTDAKNSTIMGRLVRRRDGVMMLSSDVSELEEASEPVEQGFDPVVLSDRFGQPAVETLETVKSLIVVSSPDGKHVESTIVWSRR
jgi:hypothetical protein